MATASVYFHRFYMFHSFLEFPRYVTATCALFLAGKAEETPKKCRDLIKTVRGLTNDHQFGTFGQVSLLYTRVEISHRSRYIETLCFY